MCEKSEQICEGQGHTPGPWRQGENYPSRILAGEGSAARIVAGTCLPVDEETPNETELANARLIAAAPDLLEALKLYMASVELMNAAMKDGGNVHGALSALVGAEDMANWAIAKAEGRS